MYWLQSNIFNAPFNVPPGKKGASRVTSLEIDSGLNACARIRSFWLLAPTSITCCTVRLRPSTGNMQSDVEEFGERSQCSIRNICASTVADAGLCAGHYHFLLICSLLLTIVSGYFFYLSFFMFVLASLFCCVLCWLTRWHLLSVFVWLSLNVSWFDRLWLRWRSCCSRVPGR